MHKYMIALAGLLGVVGMTLSVIMLISAFRFSEWGRVFLYFLTLVICAEATIVCFGKLFKGNKD